MTKQGNQTERLPAAQLSLALTTARPLDQRRRADVLALLSKLLLQVASASTQGEVRDERP